MYLFRTENTGVFSAFTTPISFPVLVCDPPRLCEKNNKVCVTCTAVGIPSGDRGHYYCSLYRSSRLQEQVSPVAASVSYNRQGGYSCTASVLVTKLGPGTHYFRMYLFRTGNTGVFSAFTTPISFLPPPAAPVLTLGRQTFSGDSADNFVQLLAGQTYSVRCDVTGGNPPVSRVTLICPGINPKTQEGSQVSAYLTMTSYTHDQTCKCEADQSLGYYEKEKTSVVIKTVYGPLAVSVDASPNPVNICPRTSHDVTVVCSVKFEDIYPEPVFQLYWGGQQVQNEKGKLRTDSYKKRYYTLVNHYTVNVNQAGSINFRCEVYNSVHTNEKASSNTLTVPVNAPPPSSPKLTISRGVYHGIQGYSVPMTPGQKYSASCDVSGGQPPVSSVTLTCPGVSQKTMSGTSVSLAGIVVAESADQEKCVCAAQHVSQCYNLRTEVTISVLFSPQAVTFERTDSDNNSPVDICSDSPQQIIRLQCRATSNPQPQFTVLVNNQEYARSRPERVVGSGKNTYVYSYDFVPKAGGTYNTTCTANGDKTAPVESDQLTILVREPPQTEPKIIITSIGPSGNVSKNPEVIYKSTVTNVTCFVDGGYPPVTSQDIKLTCGNFSGSEQLTLPPRHSTDGEIACSCSASHITECYSRSAHTRFNVSALPLSPEASTDNSDVTGVASVGVAVVVVVVVVVVVIVLALRRRSKGVGLFVVLFLLFFSKCFTALATTIKVI
ncbi:uncharacterized protein LOC101848916 [Aplysia californica]|uniref:Uncharacterized protein LOC101848916 n=1 Tax=Aplysia californica TaxID=6500 RepID=A0ABM1A8F4_APLCA|nr:uncharacterized protein LOC101848916 [Aplysia californica]